MISNNTEDEIGEYTEDQWFAEMQAPGIVISLPNGSSWSFGTILPCPQCKTVGFYGPRKYPLEGEVKRKYRACKFCGFWQEAWGFVYDRRGGDHYRCIALRCTNKNCNAFNYTENNLNKLCENKKCKSKTKISKWPSDDPNHEFQEYKESINRMHNQ